MMQFFQRLAARTGVKLRDCRGSHNANFYEQTITIEMEFVVSRDAQADISPALMMDEFQMPLAPGYVREDAGISVYMESGRCRYSIRSRDRRISPAL